MDLSGPSLAFGGAAAALVFAAVFAFLRRRWGQPCLGPWSVAAGAMALAMTVEVFRQRPAPAPHVWWMSSVSILLGAIGFAAFTRGGERLDGYPPRPRIELVLVALPLAAIFTAFAFGCSAGAATGYGLLALIPGGVRATVSVLGASSAGSLRRRREDRTRLAAGVLLGLYTLGCLISGVAHVEAAARMQEAEDIYPVLVTLNQVFGTALYFALLAVAATRRDDEMEGMAATDPLTRIGNRRAFDVAFARHASETPNTVAVLMADIDHFKRVNDTYGHPAGDAVLIELARGAEAVLLAGKGALYRYGGEEFAGLIPETTMEQAAGVAEDLRRSIAARPFDVAGEPLPVTVSVGVAMGPGPQGGLSATIARADAALYAAKRGGRNRVEHAGPEVTQDVPIG